MALEAMLERFAERTPLAVMAQLALSRALDAQWLNELFEQSRERQYTRELLFSTTVELMSWVVVGLRPSLHAAAQAAPEVGVSITALYDKINRTGPGIVAALVRGSAQRLAAVLPVPAPSAVAPGYRVRIVDGNHLPASDKRLQVLRGFRGAALPGQSLVVYDPDRDLIVDLVPCEDGHAQERVLMAPLLEQAEPGEFWIADRNFSTRAILAGWQARGSAFLVREHGQNPHSRELGPRGKIGRSETGEVYEQPVGLPDEAGGVWQLRRIEVELDRPTEDGDTMIRLLTNVPATALTAVALADLYRRRWRIEALFQRLESVLHSELNTLGYPRAALLAFGVAAVAYNVLAVLAALIRHQHDLEAAQLELSLYYLAVEIQSYYQGMILAIPEALWLAYEQMPPLEMGECLLKLAGRVNPRTLRAHPRGPKKKTRQGYVESKVARRHVSTAQALKTGNIS